MKRDKISVNVIRRLPRYLRKLSELDTRGVDRISSGELGRQMGLTPSQIRQDFSCFGEFGQQGYGYNVESLKREISSILGLTRDFSVILIGVGNLGRALIENFNVVGLGYRLIGAFDIKSELIGSTLGGISISHADDLPSFIEQNSIDIAIITVTRQMARETAELVADCGVRAIWNFTNLELNLKAPGVIVEDIHFSDSLMVLSYYIAEALEDESVHMNGGQHEKA